MTRPNPSLFTTERKPRMRTEQEIVADANALARVFYSLLGYQVPAGYRFDQATHPQEKAMWAMVVIAYENIEGTDVEDALACIND